MLYLASQSPRRAELLIRLGVTFRVLALDVPEVRGAHEYADEYVCRVARDKALAGWNAVMEADAVVLGADTEVILDGRVLGKPVDDPDAVAMLRRLAGRTHRVVSAICAVGPGKEIREAVAVSQVSFATMSEQDIIAYVATQEPMGKAGAYAIQGRVERFVTHLSGSYSGVMGLPLYETSQLLQTYGVL
ncbi:MAG: Maf family nucleotide pyrophosphatase [Xanthomonadaceae bacterium]|jgi:septum formation protein|nr:Maf family nucleotide pyrophosphatase [Xanthomonadaceae bacterium]